MTLEDIIKRLRKPGKRDPERFISTWTEQEVLDGETIECHVIILRTKGCYWSRTSGCSMCGYIDDCAEDVPSEGILTQFGEAMKRHGGQRFLKIYTSGSFLDGDEIGIDAVQRMLTDALARADRVLIESRPEFVSRERLEELPEPNRIEIAMGLESASDEVLQNSINKKMDFEDFRNACELCRDLGIGVRAYVLVKPPFLTEKEAVMDAAAAARSASGLADVVSLNPVNVQRNTLVEYLWNRGEYRPPWLWTVLDVVERSRDTDSRVVVSTAGAGSRRGAHNCGGCDSAIIDFLREFSLDGSASPPDPRCGCREQWLDLLDAQGPMQCSADPRSFFDR
ncbi:MAG: archaeosine biosynthesis radical SAM protein RaSEA [Candidatus Thermoplasmatota archaeon]|nr:archaeosine biosynthesis radical SAM protein RaSEA [Candidatus Thermoplasmatota archaeon]